MEEIKVGEYVRTRDGRIFKVKQINEGYLIEDIEYGGLGCFMEYVVKHSFNIIDLIEYDDVLEIFVNDNDIQKIVVYGDELYSLKIGELIAEDIKSIVTHEQFQSVEYRLEE